MGDRRSPELDADIRRCNYDYGFQMAKAGFVTYALDWIGIGEHNPANKPNHASVGAGRDWYNLLYLHPNDHGWGGNKSAAFFKKYLSRAGG